MTGQLDPTAPDATDQHHPTGGGRGRTRGMVAPPPADEVAAGDAAGPTPLPAADLDHILRGVGSWERLRGTRIFMTGATGFIGTWLLGSLIEADRRFGLGVSAVALSRDPAALLRRTPALARVPGLSWIAGDVRDFAAPEGRFDYVIHGATDVVAQGPPLDMFDTIVGGTRRVLDFAVRAGAADVLLMSSGAVYGPQPVDLARMPEGFAGAPDPLGPNFAYGEGKRVSDWLAALYSTEGRLRAKSARIYAQVGPHIPLDKHFALPNFIGDALARRPIAIRGDGSTVRSYMHAADLAVWLWTILSDGRPGAAYNVGSDEAIALGDLARRVAGLLGSAAGVRILGAPVAAERIDRYVPDTRLARDELGLAMRIGLDEAIARTARWHMDGQGQ